MKLITLPVDQDWLSLDLEPGTILKFLGKNYDKSKQRAHFLFQVIGIPVEEEPKIEFRYT